MNNTSIITNKTNTNKNNTNNKQNRKANTKTGNAPNDAKQILKTK